ncbi:hypothetical protein [Candidatus Poriferisodalis sp.]|uniref:hypothetical protein n=1 Tax=Candidatus Poriferisodalis sp. TaxID=3101277 RepID=UPI003B020BAB
MRLAPQNQGHEGDLYIYDDATRTAILETISADRIRTYLALANGSELRALRLYVRNAALASAFLGPLQALEVTLRNTMHRLLSDQYGEDWYEKIGLGNSQQKAIESAKQALRREGKTETPARIVAASTFGLWVGLLAKGNDRLLWRPLLHQAFNPTPARKDVYDQLDRLRTLRNRIAHHEPIIRRRLRDDYARILRLLQMLSPEVADWVRHHSRVPEVMATPVSRIGRF